MRHGFLATAAVLLLAACGGSGDGGGGFGVPDGADASGDEGAPADDGPALGSDPLGGSATITVDGTELLFSMDPIEFSPIEGISDVTFEACSPNFFGVGMFYALGYPVDAAGELLLADNGDIAGGLQMEIPPADWEARGLDDGNVEFTIDSDLLGVELRMRTPEQAAEVAPDLEHSWEITDTGISGSAVFTNVRQDVFAVDFEATCG